MSDSGVDKAELLVEARGLVRYFDDRPAVDDLSLQIRRGRVLGVLGPNGSGKSTTVRLLSGVIAPTRGEIDLFGERLTRRIAPRLRRRIGIQSEAKLYERLTVEENLRYWGGFFGMSKQRTRRRTNEVLDTLGLWDRRDSSCGALSKGLRQKAAIARAMLTEPELLFLDEPTAGLDPESTVDLIGHLGELAAAGQTTIVLCTHQLHGLESLCDDLVVLQEGRLLASGTVTELLNEQWPRRSFRLECFSDTMVAARVIESVGGTLRDSADTWISFDLPNDASVPGLVERLVDYRVKIGALVPDERSVQELYFRLVGRTEED